MASEPGYHAPSSALVGPGDRPRVHRAMPLRWYAETPALRSRQMVADLTAALALLGCLAIGTGVHDLTADLAGPGRSLEAAGTDLAGRMSDAGSAAEGVPLVGGELSTPFDEASSAGETLAEAGVQQQAAVATLADTLGWVTGGIPALVVLLLWLPRRLRFARQAGHAQRLLTDGVGLDVFALRALARQPISQLSRLRVDVAAGWRAGDPEVVEALAALELRGHGLDRRPSSGASQPQP